jgi:hypothetical protein
MARPFEDPWRAWGPDRCGRYGCRRPPCRGPWCRPWFWGMPPWDRDRRWDRDRHRDRYRRW